ncbi:MAG: hypothetical protein JWN04_5268, partial [Myxococcaceae bacterium]|nr:hypothetical protein [Myxococcaceae bacterium]
EIEPAPRLFVRLALAGDEFGAWSAVCLSGARPAHAWLLNARGNLALAEHALLEQLLSDVAEPHVREAGDVEQLTSYELVLRLSREHARRALARGARRHSEPGLRAPDSLRSRARFQFKLTLREAAEGVRNEDVLVSRAHEL